MSVRVSKILLVSVLMSTLMACAESTSFEIAGYIPAPKETTVSEELQLEYDRCKKIDPKRNCAQAAYDVVRVVKGLEPRPVPKGIIIILEGDGGHESKPTSNNNQDQNK